MIRRKGKRVETRSSTSSEKSPLKKLTKPMTQVDCGATVTYHRFEVPKKRRAYGPIIFHAMGYLESCPILESDNNPKSMLMSSMWLSSLKGT